MSSTVIVCKIPITCSRCDYTTYVEIPSTGHSYVDGTCTACGEADPGDMEEPDSIPGDLDGDGQIKSFDSNLLVRILAGAK